MGAVSSFHPFAAATTTNLGPENEPQGLESGEHGSFRGGTWVCFPQSIRGCMMRDKKNLSDSAAPGNSDLPWTILGTHSPQRYWPAGKAFIFSREL